MRYLILIFLALVMYSSFLNGQDSIDVQVETNAIVNLNADQSWFIIQDWENLHLLVPEVVESTEVLGYGKNAYWDIKLKSGDIIKEKMVYYNANEKVMSYIMTETPMPIQNYNATIKVEAYGVSKSFISFYTNCQSSKINAENIKNNFKRFQETYLSNIENHKK